MHTFTVELGGNCIPGFQPGVVAIERFLILLREMI